MSKQTCEECKWFKEAEAEPWESYDGYCYFNPPVPFQMEGYRISLRPYVFKENYCSKFEKRKTK